MGLGLEGFEEEFGGADAGAVVGEGDDDSVGCGLSVDGEEARGLVGHGGLTVAAEIEEDLDEALAIGPDGWEVGFNDPVVTDVLLVEGGADDDAEFIEEGGEIERHGLIGGLAEIHGGDLLESEDECAEGFEVLVAIEGVTAGEVFVDKCDGSADVADFVGDGSDEDAGAGEEMVEVGFFAVAHVLRGIDDDGGEAWSGRGEVGGEPDLCHEWIAVAAMAAALHDSAEGWLAVAERGDGGESREVGLYGLSGEGGGRESKEAVGGVVGEQDGAVGIGSNDGYGTAVDEDVKLLFGVAAGDDFVFNVGEMERGTLTAEDSFADVEAEAAEGEEVEEVAWDADLGSPDEGVEEFGEEGAGECDEDDAWAREDSCGERDGEEIEQ